MKIMIAGALRRIWIAWNQPQLAPGKSGPTADPPERRWLTQGDWAPPGGPQRIAVTLKLVATVKFAALNLKEVDNYGEFL